MHSKNTLSNFEIALASSAIVLVLAFLPFLLGDKLTNVLRLITGWGAWSALWAVTIYYIVNGAERFWLRFCTISMMVDLSIAYTLYLFFNLEAYKFASSALIFDAGTVLTVWNLAMRLNLTDKLVGSLKKLMGKIIWLHKKIKNNGSK
jgi:hypothetical protein